MAASESTKFQVNFKAPDGTLVNLYAANKEELEALLTAAQDFSALIGSVSQSFSGAPSVAPVRTAAPVASAPQGGGGPACVHGPMLYKEGVGSKGPWKGYQCPAKLPIDQKCKTIWA